MKTAGRILLSAAVAAIVHLLAFGLLRVLFDGTDWLFTSPTASTWFFTISGWVLCYLPALSTGIIVGRVKGFFRPAVTAPLGVMLFWAVFLGCGAFSWPYAYWTFDRHSIVPWLFDYWTVEHACPSLFVLTSTGLLAQLSTDWKLWPARETKWVLALLVIFAVVLTVTAARYFSLPYLDHDEVEQSHVIWVLSQGGIPYRDIHQIHMPLLWMLTWPVMHWLPRTFAAVLSLRVACAAALVGSYVAGLLMLREILGTGSFFGHGRPKNVPVPLAEPKGTVPALVLLLLILTVVPDFQFYLFRADPFMTLCAAWAVLAVVRMRRAAARYAFLCGLAFGLAASFSIRLSWLCLLVPIIALWECWRQRALRPLWVVVPNGAGFAIGIFPVVVWVLYHGVFASFWNWGIVANSGSVQNPFTPDFLDMVFINRLFAALALLGGVCLLGTGLFFGHGWPKNVPVPFPGHRDAKQPWSPTNTVLVAAFLAWAVPMTGATTRFMTVHYPYQLTIIPGAVLGTVFFTKLLGWCARAPGLRLAAVALLLVVIAVQEPAPDRPALSVTEAEFQQLNHLCSADNATCVCFAPWHPIFCHDATDLYLWWDKGNAREPFFSPLFRKKHQPLWPAAIAAIEQGTPSVVGDQDDVWERAHDDGVIDDEQYRRFQQAVQTLYEPTEVGQWTVYTRKKASAPSGSSLREDAVH